MPNTVELSPSQRLQFLALLAAACVVECEAGKVAALATMSFLNTLGGGCAMVCLPVSAGFAPITAGAGPAYIAHHCQKQQ